jgi:hypothetical protein
MMRAARARRLRDDPVLIGKLLAIGASFVVNFSLSHFVVFRRRGPPTAH